MQVKNDKIIFSSGKEIPTEKGIVGLSPTLKIAGGSKSLIWSEYAHKTLTSEERMELAHYMMTQWWKVWNKAFEEELHAKEGNDEQCSD